jgi:hypothetical protein
LKITSALAITTGSRALHAARFAAGEVARDLAYPVGRPIASSFRW